jgi:hypothetical protein
VKWDLPFLLLIDIFISVPLLKESILKFGTGARGFILHGSERNLTLHIVEGEQLTLVCLNDVLIETRSRLGAELVTGFNILGWGTLTCLIGCGTIKHSVGTAATTVESAGLGIDENLISRIYGR